MELNFSLAGEKTRTKLRNVSVAIQLDMPPTYELLTKFELNSFLKN